MSKLREKLKDIKKHEELEEPEPVEEIKDYYDEEYGELEEDKHKKSNVELYEDADANPIKKGYLRKKIGGYMIDAHDLEKFQLAAASPQQYAAIMDQWANTKLTEHKTLSPVSGKLSGSIWFLIIMMVILLFVGIVAIMFGPQLMQMFQGGI